MTGGWTIGEAVGRAGTVGCVGWALALVQTSANDGDGETGFAGAAVGATNAGAAVGTVARAETEVDSEVALSIKSWTVWKAAMTSEGRTVATGGGAGTGRGADDRGMGIWGTGTWEDEAWEDETWGKRTLGEETLEESDWDETEDEDGDEGGGDRRTLGASEVVDGD